MRRLLGRPQTQGMVLNMTYFNRLRDDAVVHVVGEVYRQENVAMARSPVPGDLPPGLPPPPIGHYKAALIPEPTNRYDRNAIRVVLWSGGAWALVGYLSRTDAANYQPLFRHLATTTDTQPAIACDAAMNSENGGLGVVLHLGTPGECAVELATDDVSPAAHSWLGKVIVFTGQNASTVLGVPLDRAGQIMVARWAGCELLPRLTKKTDLLVVANADEVTGNLQRAREYGIPVVDEVSWMAEVGLPVGSVSKRAGRWMSG